MNKIKSILLLMFFTTVLFTINGCNTIEGLGKDVRKTGNALESSANRNKNY